MSKMRLILALAVLIASTPIWARQDPEQVKLVIENFLRVQTKGLPGTASYTVGNVDAQNNLMPCPALEPFLPSGGRPWGRTIIGVRCLAEGGWSIYVPVQVRVVGKYLVSARPLTQGQMLSNDDVIAQSGDLAEMPTGILTDPTQAVGKTVTLSVTSGRPIRSDMLRQPFSVQQGQTVKVVSRGPGFEVTSEGRALNNATAGQVTQVRTGSGQTLSGVAQSGGSVEIAY